MPARLDHLVISVRDLEDAVRRWTGAGFPAQAGGSHPVGTVNALVRGPEAAYLELICAGSDDSNPCVDRVRSALGPLSWAVAVDDVDAARAALLAAGFDPQPVREGSRRTPDGGVVAWRMCDVGQGPYDADLPFLIEWTTPMPPGPDDGPVVVQVGLTPADPERVADLLLALGFVGNSSWPRRVFHEPGRLQARVTIQPLGEPASGDGVSWTMSWGESSTEPPWSLGLSVPHEVPPGASAQTVDGISVWAVADRRRFAASALLPAVDVAFERRRGELRDWPHPHPGRPASAEEYSRCDPDRYALLGVRADAWVETVVGAGLGTIEEVDPDQARWLVQPALPPGRVTLVRGTRPGTQPVLVAWIPLDGIPGAFVAVGVGDPAEVVERQPDCGCDACDTGSADLLETLDSAFVLALSGGVYAVWDRERRILRSLDGWSSEGDLRSGEAEQWLADAEAGRRTDGVLRGEPWL